MTLDERKTILLETQEKTFRSLGALSEEELLEGKGIQLLDTLYRLADQLRELPQTAGTYEPEGCPEKETVTTTKPQAELPEEATQAPASVTPAEEEKAPEEPKTMTIDDVRVKLTPHIQAGLDMPKLMAQLGLPAKLSQVDPGDYARLVEAAEKAAREG